MSCVVTTGGLLFEYYLVANGSWKSNKTWKAICRQAVEDCHFELDPDIQQQILKAESSKFHGYVLMGCNSIGNLGKKQHFYATFVSHFHGLSRMGSELLAKYGYCMSKSSYGTMRADAVVRARENTRSAT